MKPAPRRGPTSHAVRTAAPVSLFDPTDDDSAATSSTPPHHARPCGFPSCDIVLTRCDPTPARAFSEPTSFALRATQCCVAAHMNPPSHFGYHTFFCCQHAQVKHSLFARSFWVREHLSIRTVLRTQMSLTQHSLVMCHVPTLQISAICGNKFLVAQRKRRRCRMQSTYACERV